MGDLVGMVGRANAGAPNEGRGRYSGPEVVGEGVGNLGVIVGITTAYFSFAIVGAAMGSAVVSLLSGVVGAAAAVLLGKAGGIYVGSLSELGDIVVPKGGEFLGWTIELGVVGSAPEEAAVTLGVAESCLSVAFIGEATGVPGRVGLEVVGAALVVGALGELGARLGSSDSANC